MRLLAMELVEGQTLDLAITTGGLPLSRFFEIAVPLADALSAAHERGIVHRDLKPANVMLTREGRLKVLDFGLAKLVAVDSDPDGTGMATASRAELTGEGTVFGTVAYMSPEQARGGKIDARSDVFSLGVVLYEMLTGDRPFKGASSVDIISSILRDWPSPVTRSARAFRACGKIRAAASKSPDYQTSRRLQAARPADRDVGGPTKTAAARSDFRARARAEEDSGGRAPFRAQVTRRWSRLRRPRPGDHAGLSRFRYLSVSARTHGTTRRAYVLEGSIRRVPPFARAPARRRRDRAGWAETCWWDLPTSSVFAVRTTSPPASSPPSPTLRVLVIRSVRDATKDDVDLTPLEWQFQYFAYREQITPSAHGSSRAEGARGGWERRQSELGMPRPDYVDEYAFGFRPTRPLSTALSAPAAR
jgi:serine/threonine protein kinase